MLTDPALLAEADPTPHRLRSSSASDLPESIPTSLKKRRKISHNPLPSRKTGNYSISSHEYTAADIGRVVWADIGITHTQTYWWPGVLQKATVDDEQSEDVERFRLSIRLFPEKGKNSSALTGSKIRPLFSFKAVKPFIVDTNFQPRLFNPILVDKSSSSQYPSERSLLENYALAYERHSASHFDDDDNLPDVEACMIPLSQQSLRSTAGLNQSPSRSRENTSPTFSPLTSPTLPPHEQEGPQQEEEVNDDDVDLGPDPEIDISNESVLSKERAKGEYWPARVVGYVGLRNVGQRRRQASKAAKQKVQKEKYYQIRFCDGNLAEIPRSFFLTCDQPEFHVVPIGQVKTSLITFEELVEELEVHLDELDLIVKGKSTDPSIQLQHSNFLTNAKTRGLVPHEVRYGKYHEELILQVGQYLETRYVRDLSDPQSQEKDALEAFENLPASHRTQYVLDILVPHLLWLVTVEQYKLDAVEALGAEAKEEDILEKAKALARDELREADIVDQVYTLRNQDSVGCCNSKAGKKQSIKRSTSNSQKTDLGIGGGDDESDLA